MEPVLPSTLPAMGMVNGEAISIGSGQVTPRVQESIVLSSTRAKARSALAGQAATSEHTRPSLCNILLAASLFRLPLTHSI
ncbi:hypothetical protein PsorP6_001856 [Peronosclerospora sorghi]|uniref:Uncharacterized protein n=1 Tax=Peronosclerospora sorghi TaxID=230839 RepID=A0ACC0WUZ1_9STRA|nr:hypothetical protein PsorP6_001856 [Peronosclerospora sorghi]